MNRVLSLITFGALISAFNCWAGFAIPAQYYSVKGGDFCEVEVSARLVASDATNVWAVGSCRFRFYAGNEIIETGESLLPEDLKGSPFVSFSWLFPDTASYAGGAGDYHWFVQARIPKSATAMSIEVLPHSKRTRADFLPVIVRDVETGRLLQKGGAVNGASLGEINRPIEKRMPVSAGNTVKLDFDVITHGDRANDAVNSRGAFARIRFSDSNGGLVKAVNIGNSQKYGDYFYIPTRGDGGGGMYQNAFWCQIMRLSCVC